MHNIGSTQTEFPNETAEYAAEQYEYETYETGAVFDHQEGYLGAELEAELAAELMSVTSEAELDRFLGDLFKGASKAIGSFIKSPVVSKIGGMLKGVAKTALPMLGSALGNLVLPGVGGALGGQLAGAAGSALGLEAELEGLSPEDREFEVAKKVVRIGADAVGHAAHAHHSHPGADPSQVAHYAVTEALKAHAPALLAQAQAHPSAQPAAHTPAAAAIPGQPHPFGAAATAAAPLLAALAQKPFSPPTAGAPTHFGFAPGLGAPGAPLAPGMHPHHHRTGRWIRRGRVLLVLGV